jgi:hypothetical protein
MKVSGFTIIRNAIKYDYPVEEAIRSILPVCDDFYVAVGQSEDETLDLVRSIDPKIHVMETIWDDSIRKGGKVLALETDKAMKMVPKDSDWCFYIQADEAVHEKYLATIVNAMHQWKDIPEVDGLLFNYLHFFGSYDYIASSPQWYRKEIRVIKNNSTFYSYRDAQGFRKVPNQKLRVKPTDAWIYHYGWVKHPRTQYLKARDFQKLYNNKDRNKRHDTFGAAEFDYGQIDFLERFEGTHPGAIQERIDRINWQFDYDLSLNNMTLKHRFKKWVEKYFGFLPGEYKNYKIT